MGSNWSAKNPSLRCMRCFSPLELMGTVPGSAITTMPTIKWCSSRTVFVIKGTRSRASVSGPSSSATTTSKLVQVKTALESKLRLVLLLWTTLMKNVLTIQQFSCVLAWLNFLRRLDDTAFHAKSKFRPKIRRQTRHHGNLKLWTFSKIRRKYSEKQAVHKKRYIPPSDPIASVLRKKPKYPVRAYTSPVFPVTSRALKWSW